MRIKIGNFEIEIDGFYLFGYIVVISLVLVAIFGVDKRVILWTI